MQNQVEGKTAIITGGGSGIGLAIAKALIQAGANVVLASRRIELLQEQAEILGQNGSGQALALSCDVRNKASVESMVAQAKQHFGRIDILVNNTGIDVGDSVEQCSEENWDLVMDTNVKGTFFCSQAVIPHMKEQGGFILNIASQAAKYGYANAAPYCASKFAVVGFAKALQEEVREFGIRVHNLHPALVQVPTPEHECEQKPGWLQTEDLAAAAMYVLQQPRRVFLEDIGLMGA